MGLGREGKWERGSAAQWEEVRVWCLGEGLGEAKEEGMAWTKVTESAKARASLSAKELALGWAFQSGAKSTGMG